MKHILIHLLALSTLLPAQTKTVGPSGEGITSGTRSAFLDALGGTSTGKNIFNGTLNPLARANHTGTQAASTITGLGTAAAAAATDFADHSSVFYAVRYGVAANGSADDTVSLQACIDAAASVATSSKRSTVVMPAGTIMVRRTSDPNTFGDVNWKHGIRMRSNINLIGAGMDVTTLRMFGATADTPVIDAIPDYRAGCVITAGSPNLTVSTTAGLIVGMSVNNGSAYGITFGRRILSITNSTTLVMDGNATVSTTAALTFNPINMTFQDFTADTDNWNRFVPGGGAGGGGGEGECINVKTGTNLIFRNVKAVNSEQDGFDLDGGWNVIMIGCVAEDCWGSGLHMVAEGIFNVSVTGCAFRRNGFGRRASTEGGGGVGANGAGIDCMSTGLVVTGCLFENNAVEYHQLAGSANLTNCYMTHAPASTRYPTMNALPAVIAGWTALAPVGAGQLELNGCSIQSGSITAIEILQVWQNTIVRNSFVKGPFLCTSGFNLIIDNNILDPGGSPRHALTITSATGIPLIRGNRFKDYANGVRVDSAANGVISGNHFAGSSGTLDIHFTVSGSGKNNWVITNNAFSTASTPAIKIGSAAGNTIANNVGSAGGFAVQYGEGGSTTGGIVRNNSLTTLSINSGASTGNLFEGNYITGAITHPAATTFASNTWRRNTGAGCAGVFYGTTALTSGAAAINTAAANAARKYSLTRQAKNASTGIGDLTIGIVAAQTSFAIDALKADASVETGDASSIYWEILE